MRSAWKRAWNGALTFAAVYRRKLLRVALAFVLLLFLVLLSAPFFASLGKMHAGPRQQRVAAALATAKKVDGEAARWVWGGIGEAARSIDRFSNFGITIVKGMLGLTVVVLFCVLLVREMGTKVVIFDPFTVPRRLEETGLSGEVFSHRVRDRILAMADAVRAGSYGAMLAAARDIGAGPEMEVAGSKLGVKAVANLLREIFGWHQPHMSGNLLLSSIGLESSGRLRAAVCVIKGRERSALRHLGPLSDDVEQLIEATSIAVLRFIDPVLLGWYFLEKGANAEARLCAEGVLQEFPKSGRPRARALSLLGGVLEAKGDTDGAIAKYEAALAADRRHAAAYNNWGNILFDGEKYEDAIQKYAKAVQIDPKLGHAYSNWGAALHQLGEHGKAVEKCRKAAEIDPKNANTFSNWGAALIHLEKHPEAVEKCAKAVEIDGKNVVAYTNWGAALLNLKEYEGAIEKCAKAVEIDCRFAIAYSNWGEALLKLGKYEESIEKCTLAVGIDQRNAKTYFNWGEALKGMGRFEEAEEKFREAKERGWTNEKCLAG